MSSDDVKPRPEPGFRPAGSGLPYTLRCFRCSKPIPNAGHRRIFVGGARVPVGKCCLRPTEEKA